MKATDGQSFRRILKNLQSQTELKCAIIPYNTCLNKI